MNYAVDISGLVPIVGLILLPLIGFWIGRVLWLAVGRVMGMSDLNDPPTLGSAELDALREKYMEAGRAIRAEREITRREIERVSAAGVCRYCGQRSNGEICEHCGGPHNG